MKYLFYIAGRGTTLFLRIAQKLVEQLGPEIDSVHFVIGDLRHYRWAKTQALDPKIHLLYQHEKINPFSRAGRPDIRRLAELEERYGLPNLGRYISAHRLIDPLSHDAKLVYLQTYLDYYESLAREIRPDIFISGTPDSLLFLTAMQVFRKNGAVPIFMGMGRLPDRVFIVDNELEQIPGLEELYAELLRRGLSSEESAEAAELLDSYRTHRVRPVYFDFGPRTRAIPSMSRLLRFARQRLLEQEKFFEADLAQTIWRSILLRMRTPWQRSDLRRSTRPTLPEEPFFYYPLHYEPESSIDVFSPFAPNQLQAIEWTASSLPAGYSLVVKEHPNMPIGARPLGYYRRLSGIPRVRLLPVGADSYEILKRCSGVATLAGTTGFEALCFGKPVLMFGHAFFEAFREGVFRPAGIDDIPRKLQQMADFQGIDEKRLLAFLAAALQRTYQAKFAQLSADVEEPENVGLITAALLRELEMRIEVDV